MFITIVCALCHYLVHFPNHKFIINFSYLPDSVILSCLFWKKKVFLLASTLLSFCYSSIKHSGWGSLRTSCGINKGFSLSSEDVGVLLALIINQPPPLSTVIPPCLGKCTTFLGQQHTKSPVIMILLCLLCAHPPAPKITV